MTVDATSFKGILEAFVRRVASYDKYHQQAAIDAVTKLYTTASLGVFTAYSLYPRAATATNGFALLLVRHLLHGAHPAFPPDQHLADTADQVLVQFAHFPWRNVYWCFAGARCQSCKQHVPANA